MFLFQCQRYSFINAVLVVTVFIYLPLSISPTRISVFTRAQSKKSAPCCFMINELIFLILLSSHFFFALLSAWLVRNFCCVPLNFVCCFVWKILNCVISWNLKQSLYVRHSLGTCIYYQKLSDSVARLGDQKIAADFNKCYAAVDKCPARLIRSNSSNWGACAHDVCFFSLCSIG